MTDFDCVQVTTTHDDREAAAALAREVVRRRLVACAQLDEIRSLYWWDDDVQDDAEWRITLKTTASLAPRLVGVLRELHSYDVPEIVVTPITGGDGDYLAWIATETSSAGGGEDAGAA